MDRTAAILVVGNEILTGKVEESNARWLSVRLFELGVRLVRIEVIPDDVEVIAEAVKTLAKQVDHLFTSGGVGPTHDDVTIAGIARAFHREVVRVEAMAELLRGHYGERCNEDVLRMADAPAGYTLIESTDKRWPVLAIENVVVLPGVPEIFRRKFDAIGERFRSSPFALELLYSLYDEGLLAPYLNRLIARFPGIAVGSYPKLSHPHYKVKVTLESKNRGEVDDAVAFLKSILPPEAVATIPPE